MIVRSFLDWYERAPAHERIEAVQMMVGCYLAGELGSDTPQEAEAALTLVLDDPSISVRTALARELALSDRAPRHLLLALAHDEAEVAALVLARSPQLTDADLVECARHGNALIHLAIAMRETVSERVSAGLADISAPRALCGLLDNRGAAVSEDTYRGIVARHGCDGALREALNGREDLPTDVRHALVVAVSTDLLALVRDRGWLADRRAERFFGDTRELVTVGLAADAHDLGHFVGHLSQTRQLTPSLLLRGLLAGEAGLFGAALVRLSGVSASRVAGMLNSRPGAALAATCVKAGVPRAMTPVFLAALTAIREETRDGGLIEGKLNRAVIGKVLAASLMEDVEELRPVIAMLRRLDAEVARSEARADVERFKAAQSVVLDAPAAEAPAFEAAAVHAPALHMPTLEAPAIDLVDLDALEAELLAPAVTEEASPWPEAAMDDGFAVEAAPVAAEYAPPAQDKPGLGARLMQRLRRRRPEPAPLPEDFEALYADIIEHETVIQPALAVVGGDGEPKDGRYFANSGAEANAPMAQQKAA